MHAKAKKNKIRSKQTIQVLSIKICIVTVGLRVAGLDEPNGPGFCCFIIFFKLLISSMFSLISFNCSSFEDSKHSIFVMSPEISLTFVYKSMNRNVMTKNKIINNFCWGEISNINLLIKLIGLRRFQIVGTQKLLVGLTFVFFPNKKV